jgi:hypothetical protein
MAASLPKKTEVRKLPEMLALPIRYGLLSRWRLALLR